MLLGAWVWVCVSACIATRVHLENQSGNKWQTKRSILRGVRWSVPHMQMHKRMQIKHFQTRPASALPLREILGCSISCCHSSSFGHIRDGLQAQLQSHATKIYAHEHILRGWQQCWPRETTECPKMPTKIVITLALWQPFCTGSSAELQFPAWVVITINFISFLVAPVSGSRLYAKLLILLKTFGCVFVCFEAGHRTWPTGTFTAVSFLC